MSVRALSVSPRKRNIHSTGTNQFSSEETNSKNEEYCIHLSLKQIITIAIGSMIVSCLAGRVLSDQVQVNDARLQKVLLESVSNIDDDTLKTKEESGDVLSLSALTKDLDYNDTLRLFPITHAKMNSSEIRRSVHRDKCLMDSPFCNSHLDGFGKNNSLVEEERENDSENIELEKYDSNSLQQLSIDMENVEYELADSSERLTAALMQLIEQTSETLLFYECHGLEPSGLTCIGILVKGHVVARTWPNDRVIMLDLFTSGSEILIDLVPTIIDSFGSLDSKAFHIIWSHKYRGFRDCPSGNDNLEDSDLGRTLGHIGWEKERVASFQTNFQRIDIYDIIEPRFDSPTENSVFIQHDGSIQSSNSVLSERDRIVYLDGVMQSRRYGESAYHEALVHPAIFAHENPKRIAIIGGGEGATLREVLKHNTVDKVVMIEIDEKMVNVSRAYLPGWSDCTNILGSSHSCFEDPRSEMYYEDAITWFIDRFGPKGENIPGEQFDVIIMDALDPNSVVQFSDFLYDNEEFTEALSNALGEKGILVAQLGETDYQSSPTSEYSGDLSEIFIDALIDADFQSVSIYTESHGRFEAPWKFFVAMKSKSSKSFWMSSEAEIHLALKKRSLPARNGESLFRFFDGATMKTYEFPSRIMEDVWCNSYRDECGGGHGFDPNIADAKISSFEVKASSIANGGRGVFATKFVSKGSYIGLGECVNGMFIPPVTYSLLEKSTEHNHDEKFFECFLYSYIEGYGWLDNEYGDTSAGVDPSIFTFINHGCNGTNNVGTKLQLTEATIEVDSELEGIYDQASDEFHPFNERHFPSWKCGDLVAREDIHPGDELFDNYLVFGGVSGWEENLQELKYICSGRKIGTVSQYEQS